MHLFLNQAMPRFHCSSSALFERSLRSCGGRRCATCMSTEDALTGSAEIQMRCVAELEDMYWHAIFSKQTYYVAGRSYDQYRPAFELGWKSALENPDANFDDFELILEMRWMAQAATSLLPWREIQVAVRDAWTHAHVQMHAFKVCIPADEVDGSEVAYLLHPLHRSCMAFMAELQRLESRLRSHFVRQSIAHHVDLMQHFARGLHALCTPDSLGRRLKMPLAGKLQDTWATFKLRMADPTPAYFVEMCEKRERSLLAAYQRVLRNRLPRNAQNLLLDHVRQLELHLNKIAWVREHWV